MQSLELRQIQGLTSKYRAHLIKAGYITAAEVLLAAPPAVAKRTRLKGAEVESLLLELASIVSSTTPHRSTAVLELIAREAPRQGEDVAPTSDVTVASRPTTITTGDVYIDELLNDSRPALGLLPLTTDRDSLRASGKSHLCLQVALTTQLPPSLGGVGGGTVFISSEGMVPSSRLLSLAQSICSDLPDSDDGLSPWDLMDNVHTEKAQDVETLDHLLAFILPAFIERTNRTAELGAIATSSHAADDPTLNLPERTKPKRPPLPIKLVIVDSIAAPFRAGHTLDSSAGLASRAKDFGLIGDRLKRLAHAYDCAIVVVNQVTDVFDGDRPSPPFLEPSGHDWTDVKRPDTVPPPPPPRIPSPSMIHSSSPMNANGAGGSTRGMPAHEQYALPALLYNRYQGPHFSGQTPSFRSTAALGHSWSNIVNTRLMLSRTGRRKRLIDDRDPRLDAPESELRDDLTLVRKMSLVFSPIAPRASLEYVIIQDGVRSIGMPVMRESRHVKRPEDTEKEFGTLLPGVIVGVEDELPTATMEAREEAFVSEGVIEDSQVPARMLLE